MVYDRIGVTEKILVDKLEYHERHDDVRFLGIRNDLWDIRVRNAAKDGLVPLEAKNRPEE